MNMDSRPILKNKIEKKTTKMYEFRPGTFFMEENKHKIPNDMSVEEIIKEYICRDEIESPYAGSICNFVVEEKIGKKVVDFKRYQIGEVYPLCRIAKEFGKESTLYRNIENNGYYAAIKYLAGNFGYVDKEDIVFSREQILDILKIKQQEREETGLECYGLWKW